MARNPLFSVLIANYNNGCYLQDAIDSILAQTYTHLEIIIVDDDSSDNSFEIYGSYKDDDRFHVYYNEKNRGCGYSKNLCITKARGELCCLDPDDKLAPDAIEIMVDEHKKNPSCALIYSTHFCWNDLTGEVSVQPLVGPMVDGEDFLISSKNCISQLSVFKREMYLKTEGLNTKIRSAVDVDLYFLLEEVGDTRFINIPLYYYRQTNPNSISIGDNVRAERAFINRMLVSLNAFCRRIRSNNVSFKNNKEKYLFRMRWQMGVLRRSLNHVTIRFLYYCWWYWKGSGFSLKSANHILKLI